MTCATALSVERFSFGYDADPLLSEISFDVRDGEYLSIIGPNGVGKSTLIKCLNRIITGWTGSVNLYGKPLAGYSQKELARLIGYVPQASGRVLPFTVFDFVMMGRYPYLSPFSSIGADDKKHVNDALERTGVARLSDRQMDSLSGGERQKVLIAAALIQGARIMLLDEPTTFLDYKHQVECTRLLTQLNRESGVTIISVTHDINNAVLHSERIIAIKDRSIVFHGPPSELVCDGVLERIYETHFEYYEHTCAGVPVFVKTQDSGFGIQDSG
jgi:iron complex transport system ATP-binding protein